MLKLIRQFTFGDPKEIISPTVWLFISQLFSMLPSIFTYYAVYIIGSAFVPPYILDTGKLITICVAMLVCFVLQYVMELLSYYHTYFKAYRDTAQKRVSYIKKLREMPLGFFGNKESGTLINSFSSDFSNIEQALCYWLPYPISMVILIVVCIMFVAVINPVMAAGMFCVLPVSVLFMLLSLRLKGKHSTRVMKAKETAATGLNDYLHGMKDLKAYNQTGNGFKNLDEAYRHLTKASLEQEAVSGGLSVFCANLTAFMVPLTIIIGVSLVSGGALGILDYIGMLIVATKLVSPILMTVISLSTLRGIMTSAARLDEVMNTPSQAGEKSLEKADAYVFDKVSFSYDKKTNVIENLSFEVPSGKFTALVGPSGSGKSTLLRLMARFWDNDKGAISVNHADILTLKPKNLLQNISMVMQNTYLFRDTIKNNILFGRTNISDEELYDICKKACCHDFIMALPDGYDTVVGEGGSTLSGGEKQRISIARALIKKAPLLLLDEPTASLDADNEAMVQKALDEVSSGCTVVMIAHRLKTIRGADQILVLQDGKRFGIGTHEELLQKNSMYAKLWRLQSDAGKINFTNQ